jgi:hypothetical protein
MAQYRRILGPSSLCFFYSVPVFSASHSFTTHPFFIIALSVFDSHIYIPDILLLFNSRLSFFLLRSMYFLSSFNFISVIVSFFQYFSLHFSHRRRKEVLFCLSHSRIIPSGAQVRYFWSLKHTLYNVLCAWVL